MAPLGDEPSSLNERYFNIPHIFPDTLHSTCINVVLKLLLKNGELYESKERLASRPFENIYICDGYTDKSKKPHKYNREESSAEARNYLTTYLAPEVMDALTEGLKEDWVMRNPGSIFLFSVLCNEKTNRFVVHSSKNEDLNIWYSLIASGLQRLVSLQVLVLQRICTDEYLSIISNHCPKLVSLDTSYSTKITDRGLISLCGMSKSRGCLFLRDFIFKTSQPLMPILVACLLKYLHNLQILDVHNLHEGIEFYYKGQNDGYYHPRPERIRPLNLIYYSGTEKLADILDICPKLRNFRLSMSESLPSLGRLLLKKEMILEQVTLSWTEPSEKLSGLEPFLKACGHRIENLEIDCKDSLVLEEDIRAIGKNCRLLDALSFTSFKLSEEPPSVTLDEEYVFPFLTTLNMQNIRDESELTKDVFIRLLRNCPEMRKLSLGFESQAFFFNDFFLEELLSFNPLGLLEEFKVQNCSLTLISALKLLSSRPKLSLIGKLCLWDVESGELNTFLQILRQAKGMKLLQQITIT